MAAPLRSSKPSLVRAADEPAASDQGASLRAVQWINADARTIPLPSSSIDTIITSPPYWRKRDYGIEGQIGQEHTAEEYAHAIECCLLEWARLLRPTGSLFLNIGDTYFQRSLAGIPALVEVAAKRTGWLLRNRIVWAKSKGMPSPAKNRLANRHEFILHLTTSTHYYYDLFGYGQYVGSGATPGDVWQIDLKRDLTPHLAPFPEELVARAVTLACPTLVCQSCGSPRSRLVEHTFELDESRPQARRAMSLAKKHGLTRKHLEAIRATGVSDAGKALHIQTGTGKNSAAVKKLAAEAKKVLGGYFREFTFGKRVTAGWTDCGCDAGWSPGVVLDPFAGTGTTLRTALGLGRAAIGVDLAGDPNDRR
jgi:DNA modification methylase